ncbi:hypothetical protein [Streptomyces sp. NPDC002535]
MTDQPKPCRTTQHCAVHGFCHRCTPSLDGAVRHLVKAISAAGITTGSGHVYEQLAATIRDAARTAAARQTTGQDDTTPARCGDEPCNHPFLLNGCTCRPWTRQEDPPRFLDRPTDTVDMISGYERGLDCPHHAPTPLRLDLGDITHTETGTTNVFFTGPGWEPYWLELGPERAAAFRDTLTPAAGQPSDAPLTDSERKFLHFALDEAAEEMSLGDGFTDEDQAALDSLRRRAGKDER